MSKAEESVEISTWETLIELGFEADSSVISDGGAGLSIDLGGFRLTAGRMMNLRFAYVVSFGGFYSSSRVLCSIEFDLPISVESIQQCAAWIAWCLKQQLPSQEKALSLSNAKFVLWGLEHQESLPWVREASAYAARPRCVVARAWMRQAIRQLQANMAESDPAGDLAVAFDGRILSFCSTDWTVPVPAEGEPWPHRYKLSVGGLAHLPARLITESVSVSIWKERLSLGNRIYDVVPVSEPVNFQVAAQSDATGPSTP